MDLTAITTQIRVAHVVEQDDDDVGATRAAGSALGPMGHGFGQRAPDHPAKAMRGIA